MVEATTILPAAATAIQQQQQGISTRSRRKRCNSDICNDTNNNAALIEEENAGRELPSLLQDQHQQESMEGTMSRQVLESSDIQLSLDVFWTGAESGTRSAKRLPLDAISGVSDLRGLFRNLICGAFPGGPASLPDYLTSCQYYKFAPAADFASFPGDAINTRFRLVATFLGWEVNVAERELGGAPDPERKLLVTVAEFETEPVELSDGTEVIATMVTYPTVSVQRDFLDEALQRLTAAVTAAGSGARPAVVGMVGSPLEDDATSAATGAQLHF
jgi:hypothetical protein